MWPGSNFKTAHIGELSNVHYKLIKQVIQYTLITKEILKPLDLKIIYFLVQTLGTETSLLILQFNKIQIQYE